ncbi:hypothetical protein JHW43_009480 [Diplocarpon mali]|nr:hypothetical protein JHW43_009480 [Diplocarpon mali]
MILMNPGSSAPSSPDPSRSAAPGIDPIQPAPLQQEEPHQPSAKTGMPSTPTAAQSPSSLLPADVAPDRTSPCPTHWSRMKEERRGSGRADARMLGRLVWTGVALEDVKARKAMNRAATAEERHSYLDISEYRALVDREAHAEAIQHRRGQRGRRCLDRKALILWAAGSSRLGALYRATMSSGSCWERKTGMAHNTRPGLTYTSAHAPKLVQVPRFLGRRAQVVCALKYADAVPVPKRQVGALRPATGADGDGEEGGIDEERREEERREERREETRGEERRGEERRGEERRGDEMVRTGKVLARCRTRDGIIACWESFASPSRAF